MEIELTPRDSFHLTNALIPKLVPGLVWVIFLGCVLVGIRRSEGTSLAGFAMIAIPILFALSMVRAAFRSRGQRLSVHVGEESVRHESGTISTTYAFADVANVAWSRHVAVVTLRTRGRCAVVLRALDSDELSRLRAGLGSVPTTSGGGWVVVRTALLYGLLVAMFVALWWMVNGRLG